jgi:hypothetical protein
MNKQVQGAAKHLEQAVLLLHRAGGRTRAIDQSRRLTRLAASVQRILVRLELLDTHFSPDQG